ncbi:MAG: FAD-binding protein [Chloroflexi bacterium]|nr:FAD-binding protein [Chloroflexota bacterium]
MLTRSRSWDKTAEVVVIGYGCAGGVAAIVAAENGAEVLILEKQPRETHHTNTSMAGGSILTPPDVTTALEYMQALDRIPGGGTRWTDDRIVRAWAEYSATGKQWIESRGGDIFLSPGPAEHPQLPGGAVTTRHRFKGMGIGIARFLDDQIKALKVGVSYETRATHLLTNLRGRVIGVEARAVENGQTRTVRIRASRAVVLAPGGFEFDEVAKLNYLRVYPTYFTGSEALTGDGLRMAIEVGAQLWHMNGLSCHFAFKFPEYPFAFSPDFPGRTHIRYVKGEEGVPICSGSIVVDRDGKRFTSENIKAHALSYELTNFDTHRLIYPRVPSYFIFDRRRLENGPLTAVTSGPAGPVRLYRWSADNGKELEKGWIKAADTVRGLARKLGVPADNLEKTVARFNRHCEKGSDPDFGRRPKELIPIDTPPYCAMLLWPGGPSTYGGPRRNSKGQVLNADGRPIPGLYGCGELGCVFGMLYPGAGGHIAECFAFGRIVGENVARERSRE